MGFCILQGNGVETPQGRIWSFNLPAIRSLRHAPPQNFPDTRSVLSAELESPCLSKGNSGMNSGIHRRKVARESKSSKPISTVPSVLYRSLNYRCAFCLNVLATTPLTLMGWFWLLLGMRRQYCPHCFTTYMVPYGWLKYLVLPFRYIYIALNDDDDD